MVTDVLTVTETVTAVWHAFKGEVCYTAYNYAEQRGDRLVVLTFRLWGPDADQVAEELCMDVEDYRDSGNYAFKYEVDQVDQVSEES